MNGKGRKGRMEKLQTFNSGFFYIFTRIPFW